MTNGWKLYWLLVAFWLVLVCALFFWSLPFITQAAGGLVPFDARPTGYSFDDAQQFLSALSGEGRAFYLGTQHWLDLIYPAVLAGVLIIPLRWFSANWPLVLRVALIATPLIGGVADYLENAAVSQMLLSGPDELTQDMVAAAHYWTMTKSTMTSVAMTALLACLIVAAVRHLIQRKSRS